MSRYVLRMTQDKAFGTVRQVAPASLEITRGIDVSYHQGQVDWKRVAEHGHTFAFVRTADSFLKVDPRFPENWTGTLEAGLIRGAYMYFRPSYSGVDQAEDMIARIKDAGGLLQRDLPPVIDFETLAGESASTALGRALAFIEIIENELHRRPIVYGFPYFLFSFDHKLWRWPLWIADFTAKPPRVPGGWDEWVFWQTTDQGSVPGVRGKVDLNVFAGTPEGLRQFVRSTHLHPDRASLLRRIRTHSAPRILRMIGR